MKLAIALKGDQLTDYLDNHFDTCKYYCIYDLLSKTAWLVKNRFADDNKESGKNIVKLMSEQNVKLVVSCEFGQKMKQLFEKQKIQMVVVRSARLTGEEVLKKIRKQ